MADKKAKPLDDGDVTKLQGRLQTLESNVNGQSQGGGTKPVFQAAGDKLAECTASFDQLVNEVRQHWEQYPAPVQLWVRKKMEELGKAIGKLVAVAQDFLQHEAPIISLIYAASGWLDHVLSPMSKLGELTAVLTSGLTGVGVLEAIGKLSGLLSLLVQESFNALASDFNRITGAVKQVLTLKQTQVDYKFFPDEKWPVAVKG